MNENKLISIIIPVYNTEAYIEECLNSILRQSYSFYEVIMINDGSTDNSLQICKKYSEMDSRFIIINQKNSGVSISRNKGIEKSKGDILLFVDSDDFIQQDLLKEVNTNFKNNDLLCFGFSFLYKDKKIDFLLDKNIKNNDIIRDEVFLNNYIGGYLCNKAFRTSIIKNNRIHINEKIHYCEDLLFMSDYLDFCKKSEYIAKSYYNYRMRKSSVSYSFNNKKNVTILNAYDILLKKYQRIEKYKNKIEYNYILNYYKLKKIINKEKIEINENIIKNEKLIVRNSNLLGKIKIIMVKYLPHIYMFALIIKNKIYYKLFE